jgi:hypothetical protein
MKKSNKNQITWGKATFKKEFIGKKIQPEIREMLGRRCWWIVNH